MAKVIDPSEVARDFRSRIREQIKALYDERFCRMWEFYLSGSEAAFRWQDLMVFQIQLTRKNDTLPITRGYMEKAEKALAMHEMGHRSSEPEPRRGRRKVSDEG